ncbi:hypothetical protein KIN20_028572 [Parelaphostrongylus tenuis]|uniref:Uncharacterized protein n=1 Tax=Parelaphostrongylus tenuis TaxID=148309 RepID=A0AAD5WET3_PARTN|nr:hypothetical protein KIN20_028572 [Parelaphostrongylus tenuis]
MNEMNVNRLEITLDTSSTRLPTSDGVILGPSKQRTQSLEFYQVLVVAKQAR